MIVGCDQQVLEGLKKSLRPFENVWSVELSTADELAARLATPADALIVDARPADTTGSVLETWRHAAPSMVRAVLAAPDVAPDVALRLLGSAHQLIRKPVVPAQLFELVERLCVVLETLSANRVKTVLGQLGSLPALPATYAKLRELTADADFSLDAVASVVEVDPGTTANVLRIMNSAFFGLPRRVSSVRETVRYLGIQQLKNIVLTVEVFEGVATGRVARDLQGRALARACAMREVLGRTPLAEPAFAAGVLADVGPLLLATRLPIDAMAIAKEAATAQRPVVDLERERLGASHAEIGGALLAMWNMPTSLVEAVMLHHQPPQMTAAPNVATALALVTAIEESLGEAASGQRERLVERLAESFPLVNTAAVRRQFSVREAA